MNVREDVREIKKNSEVMKMIPIACQHRTIMMYIEAVVAQDLKDKNTIIVMEFDPKAMVTDIIDAADGSSQVTAFVGSEKPTDEDDDPEYMSIEPSESDETLSDNELMTDDEEYI